jgi:hypothetical protein
MTAAAWIACVLLCVIVAYQYQVAVLRDERRRLLTENDDLRRDYGAQIAQSKRMALLVAESAPERAGVRRW